MYSCYPDEMYHFYIYMIGYHVCGCSGLVGLGFDANLEQFLKIRHFIFTPQCINALSCINKLLAIGTEGFK